MNNVFRSMLVWLLLCAVPFQGFAAVRMAARMAEAMPHAMAMPGMPAGAHDGHLILPPAATDTTALHGAADAMALHGIAPDHGAAMSPCHGAGHGDNGAAQPMTFKCGSMGGCCIAAGLPPPAPFVLAVVRVPSAYIPFVDRFVPDALPRALERPPRTVS